MKSLRNEKDRSAIIERIGRLTGNETAAWGRMNAAQMVSHLVQTGELPFVKLVDDRSSFFSRKLIKPLILYVLPMPKEVKVSAEIDQEQQGRAPQEFAGDKATLIAGIEKLGNLPHEHKCLGHPFFGAMSPKEWALIAHKHIDHHLRQFGV